MRAEEKYQLQTAPEPVREAVIFLGDGITGEVWFRKLEEDEGGKKLWILQFEPEDTVLNFLKEREKQGLKNILDRKTGVTITRKFPKEKVFEVSGLTRRIIVYTDFLGNDVKGMLNMNDVLVEENARLEKENRSLRNEIGSLEDLNEKLRSRHKEYLRDVVNEILEIMKVRSHFDTQQQPQMQVQEGEQQQ